MTSESRMCEIKNAPFESEITVMESCGEWTVTVAPINGSRLAESTTMPHSFPVGFWAETMWQTNNIVDSNRKAPREFTIPKVSVPCYILKDMFFRWKYLSF